MPAQLLGIDGRRRMCAADADHDVEASESCGAISTATLKRSIAESMAPL